MTLATPADYIQVPGKVEVLCGFPSAYTTLFKIGESENGIEIRKIPVVGEVVGDRYGGSGGRPIERQFLGLAAEFQLSLSRWDPAQIVKLEKFGGLLANAGVVPLATIGALLQRDYSIRFLLYCVRTPTLSVNFPCCQWVQPQSSGRQTKYSTCSFNVTAERAPEGYWYAGAVGTVYNADTEGIPDPYVPS